MLCAVAVAGFDSHRGLLFVAKRLRHFLNPASGDDCTPYADAQINSPGLILGLRMQYYPCTITRPASQVPVCYSILAGFSAKRGSPAQVERASRIQ